MSELFGEWIERTGLEDQYRVDLQDEKRCDCGDYWDHISGADVEFYRNQIADLNDALSDLLEQVEEVRKARDTAHDAYLKALKRT